MPGLSRNLEQTLHRALSAASERKHEFATLEHLLFALIDDQDAIAVMKACNVDIDKLRARVGAFLDNELSSLIGAGAEEKGAVGQDDKFVARADVLARECAADLTIEKGLLVLRD